MKRALATVFLLTVALFSLGISGGHLGVDDWSYTYGCAFVRSGLSWTNVGRAFAELGYCAIWMPLTFISYMADFALFGGGWPVHHAVNVALHGINACLAFAFLLMLVRRFSGRDDRAVVWACAVGALVWALHPMRAEAVTFVAARKEELWTLFALVGSVAWIRFLERGDVASCLLTVLAGALACLSKPTAVCFPLLAYLLQVALTRRFFCRLWAYLPMLAVSVTVGLIFSHAQSHPTDMAQSSMFVAGFGWRLLNAAVAVGLYLWHTLVPSGVHFDYRAVFGGWPVDGILGLTVLGVSVAVLTFLFVRGVGRKALFFAVAWFLLALSPTLGIVGFVNGDQALADRYAYLPALGLSLPVSLLLVAFSSRRFVWTTVGLALVAEVLLAVPVIRSFRDDFSAFSRTLERDPDHWRALRVVGNEYCARFGRTDEGIRMLRRSLKLRGSQLTADSLAYVLALRGASGDFAEVRRLGGAFLRDPKLDEHGMMLDALAIVSMREGDYARAAALFKAALAVPRRNHAPGHSLLNLGLSLANLGKDAEALPVLQSLVGNPDVSIRNRTVSAIATIRSGRVRKPFAWQ